MKKLISLSIFLFLFCFHSDAQISDSSYNENYLRVYLDGTGDWENYIKVKFWFVNYMRDPQLAQVQVIVSNQTTASGGLEYSVFFIGRQNFEGRNDTLKLIASVDNSNRETRDELTNVIAMGMMPYLVRNGQQKYLTYDYTNHEKLILQNKDKWNNWVFTTTLNSNLNADAVSNVFAGDGSLSAAHITDKWKERFTVGGTYSNNSYETSTYSFAGTTLIKNVNGLIVKSISNHWSWGLEPAFYASTYSNIRSQFSFSPGLEYDVFPYSESVNHLFTFKYRLTPFYNTYIDSSVFNKTQELIVAHVLDATFTRIEKWGNLSTTITGSHYLNHPKAYRVDAVGQMNFHLAKGLFFNFTGNVSLINNQLSISKQSLLPEQIILQQRETLTNYSYGFQVGIIYTFGSIFNNIVNPRYEGGVNISPELVNVENSSQ